MPRYTRGQYEWFFRETDTDDDGHISLRDLENVLERFKYPIDGVTLRRIFRETDLNSDARISFSEYMYAMGQPADGILNDIVSGVIRAPPAGSSSPPPPKHKVKEVPPVIDNTPPKCIVEYELEALVKNGNRYEPEVKANGVKEHHTEAVEPKVDSLSYEDDIERQLLELTVDEPVEVKAERQLEAAVAEQPLEAVSHQSVEAEPPHHHHHQHHEDKEEKEVKIADTEPEVEQMIKHQPLAEYSITEERIDTFWLEPKFFEPQLEGKVTQPKLVTVTVTETQHEFMGSMLKGMFNKYDKDGSGSISKSELKTLFTELDQKMTDEELDYILAKEGLSDGNIDFNAFKRISTTDHSIEKTSQKTVLVAE